ncbi:MAG: hypothetical protein DWP92_04335 [Armatimonadetes bacterium]|nr:MAG: hypothetical protein DWP92_04335 [Armatimonadota bacterium]
MTEQMHIDEVISAAKRMDIEIDATEAAEWLDAIGVAKAEVGVEFDRRAGVYGHRVTMLDFDPTDLAYFRRVADIVGFDDEEDIDTALALSGSAAQSRVQTYPGDCDYFERINVRAPTRSAAELRFAEVLRSKALSTLNAPTHRLTEVKFGSYPVDVVIRGQSHTAGTPVSWLPADIEAGHISAVTPTGKEVEIAWESCAADPGWCKLDWIVADPIRDSIANASNMLDVTWEAPDGSITSLDGFVDAYFQEVYLEAESLPVFSKVVSQVSPDALDDYVEALEGEVRKYIKKEPKNYGKAAKRMYNVFRYSGSYAEAAYVRELFDEPTAALYQIHAVIRALDEASGEGSTINVSDILEKLDETIVDVVDLLEGEEETEIVRSLLELRESVATGDQEDRSIHVEGARQRLLNLVNSFFHEKLTGMPTIKSYMESM